MRERHRYRPDSWDRLEARLALTHGGPITPALIGTLSPNPRAGGPSVRIVAQVNASFDRFTADYLQAQGAFLSPGSGANANAFKAFTTQRVELLAQELTRTLSRLPGSLDRITNAHQRTIHGDSGVVLQSILYSRINGGMNSGSLLQTLTGPNVIPTTTPTGAAATLYTLTATNAIQTARNATINAVKFLVMGSFNNSNH